MNKTNLELKYFCSSFNKIKKILNEIGAKKEVVKNQTDYFFKLQNSKARLKLRVEGKKQLLVYYERPNFLKARSTTSKVKLYEVNDRQLLPFLSSALGIKVIVKKKREVWRKSNTVFHIDNVKGVGGIFEIELQKKDKITALDQKQFKTYQARLLPCLGRMIKGSNADLVLSASN